MAVVLTPLHKVWLAGATTVGVGLTVIVKVWAAPAHPLDVGVTVIDAVTGEVPVFTAAKAAMFPVPLAANPIDGVLFVQLYVAPGTEPVKLTAVVFAPLQTTWSAGSVTVGVGLTVMVKVCGVPGQPLADGVTVIVAVNGVPPVLTAVNAAMFPVPDAANPIEVVLLVQL